MISEERFWEYAKAKWVVHETEGIFDIKKAESGTEVEELLRGVAGSVGIEAITLTCQRRKKG